MRMRLLAVMLVVLAAAAAPLAQQRPSQGLLVASPFETYLELLRQQVGIPGISAAIVQNGEIIWERGFGFQNQESRVRATPDTPYPIGDLSQTVSATLLLECMEQRRLNLDDLAARHGVSLPEASATIRHVLTHTSAAPPGEAFRYEPERYGQLARTVEECVPQPYRKTVAVQILERLAMKDSVPGRDVLNEDIAQLGLFSSAVLDRYARVIERVAVPYKVDKKGRATRMEFPLEGINAASGIISTVRDLARFDAALDDAGLLLNEDTLAVAWTNTIGKDRTPLPTGQGWFVQKYDGEAVVWQFGMIPNAYSSLIVKLPARHVTLILLANSDGLSSAFDLPAGDVTRSLFATLFLRMFT